MSSSSFISAISQAQTSQEPVKRAAAISITPGINSPKQAAPVADTAKPVSAHSGQSAILGLINSIY